MYVQFTSCVYWILLISDRPKITEDIAQIGEFTYNQSSSGYTAYYVITSRTANILCEIYQNTCDKIEKKFKPGNCSFIQTSC